MEILKKMTCTLSVKGRSVFMILAVFLGFSSSAAFADVTLSLKGGVSALAKSEAEQGATLELDYDTGYTLAVGLGYDFPVLPLSIEGELMYQKADIDQVTDLPNDLEVLQSDGNTSALALMVNGYVNLPVPLLKPYVGVGVGGARVDFSGISANDETLFDEAEWKLAYQGMLGVRFSVPFLPINLMAEYRYFATSDLEAKMENVGDESFDISFASHSALLGARLDF